jgi:hypothetical protein
MTTIDLDRIVHWCYAQYGPCLTGGWDLVDLKYISFENPAHATFFFIKMEFISDK